MKKIDKETRFEVQAKVTHIKNYDTPLFYPCCGFNMECKKKAIRLANESKKSFLRVIYVCDTRSMEMYNLF